MWLIPEFHGETTNDEHNLQSCIHQSASDYDLLHLDLHMLVIIDRHMSVKYPMRNENNREYAMCRAVRGEWWRVHRGPARVDVGCSYSHDTAIIIIIIMGKVWFNAVLVTQQNLNMNVIIMVCPQSVTAVLTTTTLYMPTYMVPPPLLTRCSVNVHSLPHNYHCS